MPEEPTPSTPIPESLRKQLDQFRRQLWKTKIAEAIFAGIFGLLLSYLVVFALDRIWPTPGIVRLAILLAGTSLMAIFAPIWLHRWVWKHRNESQLAKLIARRHPGLGDRLLGVVELQQQTENTETLSPRLRAAAMEAVAAEADRRKLDESLPISRHFRWSLAVIALLLAAGTAILMVPKAGFNSFKRWLLPLSSTPRYTFTLLENVPSVLPVPQGEAFTLDLNLSPDSEWRPELGTARYGRQDPVESSLAGNAYQFEFPGQQDDGLVKIEIGDARHAITVKPSLRPTVNRSIAEIDYPDYLELSNRTVDLSTGTLSTVRGSKVRLSIEATRALATAEFGPLSFDNPTDTQGPGPADVEDVSSMAVRGALADTDFIEIGTESLNIPMRWVDSIGLAGAEGFKIRIDGLPDEAPTTYIQGVQSQKVMLPDDTIDLEVTAEDDFGLREYGLEWQGEFTRPTDATAAQGDLQLEKGAPDLSRSTAEASFSPATFGIVPQKLVLRAYAEDYLPGRGRSYSQPITLYIMSLDEHSQMLKNQFDRTIGELEDLARKERNLLEENQRLERLEGDELQSEEAKKKLEAQQQAEKEQAEKMMSLSEKMEELLKESARNGSIDKETLKKMAESMQAMRELGEEDMPEVEGQLGEAQDQRNTEKKSEEDVKEAVENQKKVLEKMKETIDKANDANERFEASTFIARLKKSAEDEDGVASASLDGSDNFGLRPEELDPAILNSLHEITRQQSDTASDVRWIQEDLAHFFTRTDKQIYRDVHDAMNDSAIDLGLDEVRLRLMKNHGYSASTEASKWAEKLREWAKLLEGDKDDDGGGGGGGGGEGSEDEDFEFMLRVMRLIQQEQQVRARTRSLETLRRSFELNDQP